jgi:pimeloyl-ACP methyl ester carboxylesterase
MGGADSHFPDPQAEGTSIAAKIGGRLVLIPGAGHYPQVEYPDRVHAAITEFLAESAT